MDTPTLPPILQPLRMGFKLADGVVEEDAEQLISFGHRLVTITIGPERMTGSVTEVGQEIAYGTWPMPERIDFAGAMTMIREKAICLTERLEL
jgi:hypothetical protein